MRLYSSDVRPYQPEGQIYYFKKVKGLQLVHWVRFSALYQSLCEQGAETIQKFCAGDFLVHSWLLCHLLCAPGRGGRGDYLEYTALQRSPAGMWSLGDGCQLAQLEAAPACSNLCYGRKSRIHILWLFLSFFSSHLPWVLLLEGGGPSIAKHSLRLQRRQTLSCCPVLSRGLTAQQGSRQETNQNFSHLPAL